MTTTVHYITHLLASTLHGGAEIQMISTMQRINALNGRYQVHLFEPWKDKIGDSDIVHVFNPRAFPVETLRIAKLAKEKGVKLVFSPIFYHVDRIESDSDYGNLVIERFSGIMRKLLLRSPFSAIDPYRNLARAFGMADLLLPTTETERAQLEHFFRLPKDRFFTVPNGVDSLYADGDVNLFRRNYGLDQYILFVGRIEPQKNVLRLIQAFESNDHHCKLVIIGSEPDRDYASKCRRQANDNVLFLPPIPHDSDMLRSAYAGAKIFALPSYYEMPGLTALEAGLSGANLVITKNGGTKEYFDRYASYVDPESITDIARGIKNACSKPRNEALSERIRNRYTWDRVVEQTLKAYSSLDWR